MWLILGGTGFLGTALRRLLDERGVAYAAPGSGQCDVRDPEALKEWMDKTIPEVVVNCVAVSNVDFCEGHPEVARQVNARAPAVMAGLCRERGASFVHFSTDYVFSGSKRSPYRESDLTDPVNAYGWSKRLGEEAVQAVYPQGSLIIRTAWLFSAERKGFFVYLADALARSREKLIIPRQEGSPTYLEDLAGTTLNLIKEGRSGIYHVVNRGGATWEALADFFLARFQGGRRKVEIVVQKADTRPARRPDYSVLSTEKLQATAGVVMRPWREAAEACIDELSMRRKEQA